MFFGSPADQEVAHEMLRDPQTLKEFVADIINLPFAQIWRYIPDCVQL
jgi:hypothetical protein